jgi:hypothetical protein
LRAVEDAGGPSAPAQADPRLSQVIEMIADTSNSLEVYDS